MITAEKITTTDVKRFNKNRIFRLIHYADKISRQEIADILQLSLPTVNQNLKILLDQNLIEFGGSFESTGGRKAQMISVRGMSKCTVSVNISDSELNVALIDLKGEIICSVKKMVTFVNDPGYGKWVAELVADVIKRNPVEQENILGVGITMPGVFDNENKIILKAPTMGIKNFSVSNITDYIKYPCIVMNDARANAYAEFWFGRRFEGEAISADDFHGAGMAESHADKIYIMLNTGVGGACIEKERLRTGSHNRYGEFGHMTIHPGGRKCFCGKDGCVEAYTSSRRLSTELGITLEEFFYEAKIGNERYNVLLHEYLDDLTTGINNLYTMSDGDIILGGPVAKYLPPYQNEITRLLIEKYSFDTDASYFSFAKCTPEQSDTGAALTFLGDFISSI